MLQVKPNDIARQIAGKSSDIQAIALFNPQYKLIAYALPPGIQDIEAFRTKAKKRIIINLLILLFIVYAHGSYPLVSMLALAYVGGNTFYGWDKYHIYCRSTYAFNIAISLITYGIALYYAHYSAIIDLAIKSTISESNLHLTPIILLLLIISILSGYLLSKKTIGRIHVLSEAERQDITLESIAKNDNIEKYVLCADGTCNRLVIKSKTETAPPTHKTFKVQVAQNLGKLKR